jgi:exonuclease III
MAITNNNAKDKYGLCLNTPLSSIDRSSKQKINKEIQDLKYTIDQMDLLDVYRTFHPTSTQYTFFSAA